MTASIWRDDLQFLSNIHNLGYEEALEIEMMERADPSRSTTKMGRLAKFLSSFDWSDAPSVSSVDMPPGVCNRPGHVNTIETTRYDQAIDKLYTGGQRCKGKSEEITPNWEVILRQEINRIVKESDDQYSSEVDWTLPFGLVSFDESV